MTKLLAVILAIALTACATGELAQHLEEGMSKEQAISILGKPDGFQRSGEFEALKYTNRLISGWSWDRADYSVILRDGRGSGVRRRAGSAEFWREYSFLDSASMSRALLFCLVLCGCTTASKYYGKEGEPAFLIECGAALSFSICHERAKAECPNGYKTISETPGFNRKEIRVQCKE